MAQSLFCFAKSIHIFEQWLLALHENFNCYRCLLALCLYMGRIPCKMWNYHPFYLQSAQNGLEHWNEKFYSILFDERQHLAMGNDVVHKWLELECAHSLHISCVEWSKQLTLNIGNSIFLSRSNKKRLHSIVSVTLTLLEMKTNFGYNYR